MRFFGVHSLIWMYIYLIFLYNFLYCFYDYKDLTVLTLNQRNISVSLKEHLKLRREKARSLVQLKKKSVVFILETSNVEVWDYIVIDNTNSITSIIHNY